MESRKQNEIKHTFFTETDLSHANWQSFKATLVIYLVLAVLASVGLLIAWKTFLYFEAFAFIIAVSSFFVNRKNTHEYRLRFENDILHITDKTTGESFWVYDIPASDFIITQSAKEKKLNICGVAIKETVFILPGVKHCNELKKYISENFQ